jgi:hypothetical protein
MKWPARLFITVGIAPFKPAGNQLLPRCAGKSRNTMNGNFFNPRTCLNLIGAIILVAGLGSAALIYQGAVNAQSGVSGHGDADGTIYPLMPENSKLYRHNLEVYGGKFTVIMDDFRRWFVGLWHGKSLAVIIACTTLMISLGLFYKAHHLTLPLKPDVQHLNNPGGTG